jgi:hypothetical protein
MKRSPDENDDQSKRQRHNPEDEESAAQTGQPEPVQEVVDDLQETDKELQEHVDELVKDVVHETEDAVQELMHDHLDEGSIQELPETAEPTEKPRKGFEEPTEDQQKPQLQGSTDETVLRNGIPIPADSELLTSFEVPNSTELSPHMLIKANLASLPLTLQANDTLPIRVQFLINSIPVLDNVATQILRLVGVGPYEETLAIITNEEPTPQALVYRELVELFEQVKKIFSEEDPFLDLKHIVEDVSVLSSTGFKSLREMEDTVDSALKKTNLATFLLATLGTIEVGFFYLNESFLDVFCPTPAGAWFKGRVGSGSATAGKLLKAQAGLFLELKTQSYISALESGARSKEEILDDIFPNDLEDMLLQRRRSTQLTPAESDFILRCNSRRESLLGASDDEDLSENYEWLIFLKELFNYVSKNIGFLLWGRKGRASFLPTLIETSIIDTNLVHLSKEEIQKRLKIQREKEVELKERERRELEREPQNASRQSNKTTSSHTVTTGPPRIRNIMRRTWSTEEEKALVEALKEYGPHWSKILEYYGAGGKVSEALRSRTQVQLKDKARNWKMAYLKNGNPVPDYLQKVTGELDRDDKAASARRRQKQRLQMQKEGTRPVTREEETSQPRKESEDMSST